MHTPTEHAHTAHRRGNRACAECTARGLSRATKCAQTPRGPPSARKGERGRGLDTRHHLYTANMSGRRHTEVILNHLYAGYSTLEEAVQRLSPSSCTTPNLYQDNDPPSYQHLCTNTYVAWESGDLVEAYRNRTPQQFIVIRQSTGANRDVRWPWGVFLSHACRCFTANVQFSRDRNQFEAFLVKMGFKLLHERIGSNLLLFLFQNSVFVPLDNGCHLQITGKIYNVFQSSWVPLKPSNSRFFSVHRQASHSRKKTGISPRTCTAVSTRKEMAIATSEPSSVQVEGSSAHVEESCDGAGETVEHKTFDHDMVVLELNSECMEEVKNGVFESQMPKNESLKAVTTIDGGDGPYSPDLISCGTQDSNTPDTHSGTGMECSLDTDSQSSYDTYCSHRRKRLNSNHWNEPGVKRSRLEQRAVRKKDARKTRKKLLKRFHERRIHRRSVQLLKKTRRKRKVLKRKGKEPGSEVSHKKNFKRKKQTLFDRTYSLYSTNTREAFPAIYALEQVNDSITGARRLVGSVFQGKPMYFNSKQPVIAAPTISPWSVVQPPSSKVKKKVDMLPRRLRQVVPLFQKLLHNHKHKVRYHQLLKIHCPVPEGLLQSTRPHNPPGTTGQPTCEAGDSSDSLKEKLAKMVSAKLEHSQVYRFLRSVLVQLVPRQLWGSESNKRVFFKHLKRFISLRRWETMSARQVMQGFKPFHCGWLKLPSPSNHGNPHPPSVSLCEKFIYWLMNEVIIRTIRAFFYVTEHSVHRNHVFYYRKRVWSRVQRLALEQKVGTLFQHISQDEAQMTYHWRKTLGISKLRFLPKTNGVRPITNLSSRVKLPFMAPGRSTEPNSVNYQLQGVFHVLNYEKTQNPDIVGCACFGYQDIHEKLKRFKAQRNIDSTPSPLYFVQVDIANCYDTMLPNKLYEILQQNVFSKATYLLRRYTTVFISRDKIKRLFNKVATTREECVPFFEYAQALSQNMRNCIFTDQVTYPVFERGKILEQMRSHLFGNIVTLGGKYYKQAQGIVQGSKLSSMLCGFYYGEMEKTHLPRVDHTHGLLMRLVDDFLLITSDSELARQFLLTMSSGVSDFNCSINQEKTLTNFKMKEDGSLEHLTNMKWMEWCGLFINTSSLDVRVDYSRYSLTNIRDNITIVLHSQPLHHLLLFTRRAIQLRCMPLLVDGEFLSEKSVLINVYQGFLLAGVKFLVYVTSIFGRFNRIKKRHFLMLFKIAVHCFSFFWQLAHNKCTQPSGDSSFGLSRNMVMWLGCHAFKEVLSHHQARQLSLLSTIFRSKIYSTAIAMGSSSMKRCQRATKIINSSYIFTVQAT